MRFLITAAAALIVFTQASLVYAQTPPVVSDGQYGDVVNDNTVGIVGGAPSSTFTHIINDMAGMVDDGEKLRVLPIVGKGGRQNLLDLLYLKGVDLALIHANALSANRDEPRFRNLDKRVCYIAQLYVDELHMFSDKVTALEQLKGKTVAYHDAASQQAGERLFRALDIKPKESLLLNMLDAAQKMKAGEVQAIIRIAAKPMAGADQLLAGNNKLRLVKVPYSSALAAEFLPAKLDKDDYDALIGGAGSIDTVGVGVVLGSFNWAVGSERYKRVAKLVDAFFGKVPQIAGSRASHPKWRELDLQAQSVGWQRCPAAQDALERLQSIRLTVDEKVMRNRIKQVVPEDPGEQEKLFKQFIEWLRTQKPGAGTGR